MPRIAAAILAGGKSTRFGKDKFLQIHQGKTFLQIMQGIFQSAGLAEIYISHPDYVADIITDLGPLGGVHAVLSQIPEEIEHVIFAPIDMPKLSCDIIAQLINAPHKMKLVYFDNMKMPFRIARDKAVCEKIEGLVRDSSNLSLGHFFDHFDENLILPTTAIDPDVFVNINTRTEFERLNSKG